MAAPAFKINDMTLKTTKPGPGIFIRSTLFNLAFYGTTALMCIACLPGLLLPKAQAMTIVHSFVSVVHFLEKHILKLDYEIRGAEHLPAHGPYIIAAKHYSPYETFKLHLLFDDPAIILKKELLRIPLWGAFLKKIEPIAIDRSAGKAAMKQVVEGSLAVKEQARPIVIFPQGTRVWPNQTAKDKPYKAGIARIQEATQLPIIPLAMNTGAFWPRHSWIKKPGTIVFEYLPPIMPGQETGPLLTQLEHALENKSHQLMIEGGYAFEEPASIA